MSAPIIWTKHPDAAETFWINCGPLLPDGVTLSSVTDVVFLRITTPELGGAVPTDGSDNGIGLVAGTKGNDTKLASGRIEGGLAGRTYLVYFIVVLSNGDTAKPWGILDVDDGYSPKDPPLA